MSPSACLSPASLSIPSCTEFDPNIDADNSIYFSSFAYVLLCALRPLGLTGTELARAQCGSIRLKLLKIGAQVHLSVRRVWLSFSESYPYAALFRQVLHSLRAPPPAAGTA